jgi:hypothetical protein
MVDPCHFDVIVSAVPERDKELVFVARNTQWTINGTSPEYISFTTPSGAQGGIWVLPGLAPNTVNFFRVDNVQAYIEQHGADILNIQWQGQHPRDNQPAAIFKDAQCILWGIHQSSAT